MDNIEKYINIYIYDGKNGGFIYHDIQKSIDLGLNYLTALGLTAYTEYLGSLFPPIPGQKLRGSGGNFYKCYFRMGKDYAAFDNYLRKNYKNGVYQIYRNGLTHAYFIGGKLRIGRNTINLSSIIAKTTSGSMAMGIAEGYKIGLATQKYFEDLMMVIKEFRKKVLVERDEEWIEAFLEGSGLKTHSMGSLPD